MNNLVHADIFFFVTTIALVVMTLLFIIAVLYVLRILKDLRYISSVVRTETDLLARDIEEMRERMKKEGVFSGIFPIIARLFGSRDKKVESKKQRNESK